MPCMWYHVYSMITTYCILHKHIPPINIQYIYIINAATLYRHHIIQTHISRTYVVCEHAFTIHQSTCNCWCYIILHAILYIHYLHFHNTIHDYFPTPYHICPRARIVCYMATSDHNNPEMYMRSSMYHNIIIFNISSYFA